MAKRKIRRQAAARAVRAQDRRPTSEGVRTMQVQGSVHVELVSGGGPGQLQAIVSLVGEDGTIYQTSDPFTIAPGNTLTYGTVWTECDLKSNYDYQPTQVPGAGSAKGQPAAARPGQPQPHAAPGRK